MVFLIEENNMKYQYSLTAIEPLADGELREIVVCTTESLKAICHEILRYRAKKKKPEYPNQFLGHDFSRDARFIREILVEECNELGQEVWETDHDFKGNDDFYVSTYCNGWRKFVRDLMKGES